MKITLLRFSSLGDLVLQTSFISWLKHSLPGCNLSLITLSQFEGVLDEHQHLDEVKYYHKKKGLEDIKGLWSLSSQLRDCDLIIDLHGTTRSFILKHFCWQRPRLSMDKRRWERSLLVHAGINFLGFKDSIHSRHISDLFNVSSKLYDIETLKKLNRSFFGKNISLTTPFCPPTQKQKLIILAQVASFKNKRWSIERFKELVVQLLELEELNSYKIICLAGKDDTFCDLLNTISSERFENLQGQTSLSETTHIIASATVLVGNDSGLGHIAEAHGVPIVAIFGPTHESLGFAPHLSNSKSLAVKMWCRPCSPTGAHRCYRLKQHCLEKIDVQMVKQEVINVLN